MNRLAVSFFLLIIISIFGPIAAEGRDADERDSSDPPVIRTQGDAILTVEPDLAELMIGVETEDPSAQAAARANAARADAVIKALREILGPQADIKTVEYSITPVYPESRKEQNKPVRYRAENTVLVKTDLIRRTGEIIDSANKAGANSMRSLRFSLKDDAAARRQALERAARAAREKANAIASALGVKVKRILSAEESGAGPGVMFRSRGFSERFTANAPTPIEAGSLEIQATVTLTVEITQ